ncbi:hypothetical protein D187_007863 [Cystobacter fuscus DSM 2262]|uniref:Uncharacterized protein n=1 Tax=Cystobacter fuscus (strain ATCC 25194 / DSM 2262 / NBRC 100088 / M29) TaxID=1242864 RepID=S9P079_CYSF2|nr:hypothetical protein [Cystobacter fuscus]EPX56521.1 hypothetical protein D187_007863 [Cystobacter fuscus DSM 2262]
MIMEKNEDGFRSFRTKAFTSRELSRSVPALFLAAALLGCGAGSEGGELSDIATTARGEDRLELATNPADVLPAPSASAVSCTPLCGGSCTPVQLAQATGLDKPILPVGNDVYFAGAITYEASYSYFGRVSKQGGSRVLLAQNLLRPPTFLSNATSAYAVVRYPGNSGLGHLNEINPDGSITPVPGIDGSRSLTLTAVDATKLYALSLGDGSVWSTSLSSGGAWTQTTRSIANEVGRSVRVDGTSVYIVTDDVAKDQSTVWKASKQGLATPTRLVTIPGSIVSLTPDETDLYFADRTGGIFKVSKSGGAVTRLASTATNLSITVDAERYYWFNGTALTATCKNGGGSQVLATVSSPPEIIPEVIAVDGEGVYWRNSSQVWKIAK